jgi:hypothetical protein
MATTSTNCSSNKQAGTLRTCKDSGV